MYKYPYGNMQQLNLDWFLAEWENFKQEADETLGGIDGALQAEIDRVEAAMTDLYAARDAAIAARQGAAESAASSAQSAANSAASAQTSIAQASQAAQAAASAAQRAAAALTSEQNANNSAGDAEAWAVGTRFTVPVPPSTAQYQNNSKWWAEKAKEWYDAAEALLESLPEDVTELLEMYETLTPLAEEETLTGDIVTFESDFEGAPIKQIAVDIEPLQAGSGDPSPENIRPISGWTGAKIERTGKNLFVNTFNGWTRTTDYWTYPIHLPAGDYHLSASLKAGANIVTGCTVGFAFGGDRYSNFIRFTACVDLDGSTRNPYTLSIVDTDSPVLAFYGTEQLFMSIMQNYEIQLEVGNEITEYSTYTGNQISVTFPDEAGTVYGAKITLNPDGTGEMVVDKISVIPVNLPVSINFAVGTYTCWERFTLPQKCPNALSSQTHNTISNMKIEGPSYYGSNRTNDQGSANVGYALTTDGQALAIYDADLTLTDSTFTEKYRDMQVVYPLESPITYHLSTEQISGILTTLKGINNVWADAGNVTITVGSYVETITAQQAAKTPKAIVCANEEPGTTASKNYAVNDFLIWNNQLYKVTATIAEGATLTTGANITATTITAEITALLNA